MDKDNVIHLVLECRESENMKNQEVKRENRNKEQLDNQEVKRENRNKEQLDRYMLQLRQIHITQL